ncbi:DUF2147 domain-containing protein [Hansschlegelia zhihuaiae]|uniref:DUF2147 domain-containing protein n=1 Tax=Hansschlegelia zhihuaiae TaxID=405005 RepID=A0A4Q0MLM3_9HYPH|nr:DUF2147 domain-containing protein [Hansschlegelia zhihuaiae]RXF74631.1 DUF2147 domain-containing protein [Hansschlegelia zhihuaiae]
MNTIRFAAAAAALTLLAQPALAAPVPSGLWRLDSGKAQVRISDCGGSLCATLASLRKPNDKSGLPKRDKRNPNPALRDRPVIGLSLVSGMRFDGAEWTGRFYNPDDGRTYAGRITPDGSDRLKLKGCVLGLVCKTQAMTRID